MKDSETRTEKLDITELLSAKQDLPWGWFAGLDSSLWWTEYKKRKPRDIGFEIFDTPPTQVDIRYLEVDRGGTPEERSVRLDWEGRNTGFFVPVWDIDTEKETIKVWVWDIGREAILFRVPGEDMNATGTQLWASREWLERMRVV